jgi:hypothetical protein
MSGKLDSLPDNFKGDQHMARKNTPTIEMPLDLLKGQLDLWADAEEVRNLGFLNAIGQRFQEMLTEYYKAGATPADRLQRLEEICQTLIETGFEDKEGTSFTIAAKYATPVKTAQDLTVGAGCRDGQQCIRGACV